MKIYIVVRDIDKQIEVAEAFKNKQDAIDYILFSGFTEKQDSDVWVRKTFFRRGNSDLDMYYIEEKEVK
ncbi:hypothetical protein [Enterococcus sp. LJL90]